MPQPVVHADLVGMAIERSVVAVENPGAKVSQVNLGNALELLGDGGVRVFHARGVHLGGFLQYVGALKGVQTGLPKVIHDRAGAHDRGVEPGETVKDPGPLGLFRDGGQQAVAVQVIDTGDGHAGQGQRPEQGCAEAHRRQNVFLVRVHLAGSAAQPALGAKGIRLTGVPDVHGAEVGPGGVGVADAVNNAHVPLVVHGLERPHLRVESDLVVQGQLLAFRDHHRWTVISI